MGQCSRPRSKRSSKTHPFVVVRQSLTLPRQLSLGQFSRGNQKPLTAPMMRLPIYAACVTGDKRIVVRRGSHADTAGLLTVLSIRLIVCPTSGTQTKVVPYANAKVLSLSSSSSGISVAIILHLNSNPRFRYLHSRTTPSEEILECSQPAA